MVATIARSRCLRDCRLLLKQLRKPHDTGDSQMIFFIGTLQKNSHDDNDANDPPSIKLELHGLFCHKSLIFAC